MESAAKHFDFAYLGDGVSSLAILEGGLRGHAMRSKCQT